MGNRKCPLENMVKNILLTGGHGFIGKNIKESYLAEKYNILTPTSQELNLLDQESVDIFFRKHHVDIVIHSAGKPGHRNAIDPSNIFYSNSRMFFNLDKNKDYYEKMIVMGSGAIYDMRFYKPKMKEDYFGKHIPIDEHGLCKYVCGKYIESSDHIIDLRIFGIFGKYEDYAIRFISNMICKSLFDIPFTMKQNKYFDYLYVDDLPQVIDYFITNENHFQSYNVTPYHSISLLDIIQMIKKISNKDLPVILQQEGLGLEYSGDNTRLISEFKEMSYTPIEQAIERLYDWYLSQKNNINKELLLTDK